MKYKRYITNQQRNFFLLVPRGTGRSTWLKDVFADALVVDLLREDVKLNLEENPERLAEIVDAHPETTTVIVDEIQRVPALLSVVHRLIERDGASRRYVLTGYGSKAMRWKQKRPHRAVFQDGGDKGSRTPDLLNAIETLYQLSYIPM